LITIVTTGFEARQRSDSEAPACSLRLLSAHDVRESRSRRGYAAGDPEARLRSGRILPPRAIFSFP
jgi:hypothetical protein